MRMHWIVMLLLALRAQAQTPARTTDLSEMRLEDLMNVEVTTVSKKEQKLSHAAAAVYVLTQEDLRRSGVTSIMEALRMVPGVQVARIDSNKWAISARGFNGRLSDKLLVMIDGRTVYTPLYSGVFWELQDTLLADVDRIEVIRGPGATMWGANAVNGVINVITKAAKDTQGGLLVAVAGDEDRGRGGLRAGGRFGEKAFYRVHTQTSKRNHQVKSNGDSALDEWETRRSGFRLDWEAGRRDSLTFQGDVFDGKVRGILRYPSLAAPFLREHEDHSTFSGGNMLGRWKRRYSDNSDSELQVYFDRSSRASSILGEHRDTVDFDFRHRVALSGRHELMAGGGYRRSGDALADSFVYTFQPNRRTVHIGQSFVQDEITLVPDRLWVTLGSKFETNSYSRFEFQPGARVLWTPNTRHSAWFSVARAVATPARIHHDITATISASPGPNGLAALAVLHNNKNYRSQDLLAWEAGFRRQWSRMSLDVAVFRNEYDHLLTVEPGTPSLQLRPAPHLVAPLRWDNLMAGTTFGVETAAQGRINSRWRWSASHSWLRMQLNLYPGSQDIFGKVAEGKNPRHQFHARSYFDVSKSVELDTAVYYVSSLRGFGVPAYTRLDVRLGWRVKPSLELSAGGRNLLDPRHVEFVSEDRTVPSTEVGRGVYGRLMWRF